MAQLAADSVLQKLSPPIHTNGNLGEKVVSTPSVILKERAKGVGAFPSTLESGKLSGNSLPSTIQVPKVDPESEISMTLKNHY